MKIKFRVYHPDEGKYHYFDYLEYLVIWQGGDGYKDENCGQVIFEQYTGYDDEFGVEIYVGDILKIDKKLYVIKDIRNLPKKIVRIVGRKICVVGTVHDLTKGWEINDR